MNLREIAFFLRVATLGEKKRKLKSFNFIFQLRHLLFALKAAIVRDNDLAKEAIIRMESASTPRNSKRKDVILRHARLVGPKERKKERKKGHSFA